jgi:hypothetical protein
VGRISAGLNLHEKQSTWKEKRKFLIEISVLYGADDLTTTTFVQLPNWSHHSKKNS